MINYMGQWKGGSKEAHILHCKIIYRNKKGVALTAAGVCDLPVISMNREALETSFGPWVVVYTVFL